MEVPFSRLLAVTVATDCGDQVSSELYAGGRYAGCSSTQSKQKGKAMVRMGQKKCRLELGECAILGNRGFCPISFMTGLCTAVLCTAVLYRSFIPPHAMSSENNSAAPPSELPVLTRGK